MSANSPPTNTGQKPTTNEVADKPLLERKSSHFIAQEDELPIKIIGPYDEEILPEDIVIPPDGGWGWVIVFAAFTSNLVVDGSIFSFGLLLSAIVAENEEIAGTLAWVSGVLTGFYLGTGPFVSALANAVGFRATAITGSFVSAFGLGMAYYFCRDGEVDVVSLFVFYAFIGGVGMCLLYVPSIITVGYYFEKKRALATGIAVCGSGIGTFVFAPIITTLVKTFDWQTTILFQAGFMLSTVFVVALYRPLKPIKHSMKNGEIARVSTVLVVPSNDNTSVVVRVKHTGGSTVNTTAAAAGAGSEHKVKAPEEKSEATTIESQVEVNDPSTLELYQRENRQSMNSVKSLNQSASLTPGVHVTKRFRESAPTIPQNAIHQGDTAKHISAATVHGIPSKLSQPSLAPTVTLVVDGAEGDFGESRVYRVASKNTLNRPLYRSHIFYAGTLENLPEHSRTEEGQANVEWEATAVKPDEEPKKKPARCKCRCSVIKNLLDFSLLKSPTFSLLALSGGVSFLGFFVPFMYLTSIATANEITADEATALIVVIGVSNTLGRVICGFLADRLTSRVLLINNVALTLGGFGTALVPLLSNLYSLYIIYSFIFGFCIACVVSLRSILVVELMGLNKLTNAIGLILLFQGFAAFFGSPLAGYIAAARGSFDISFYVAGSLMFISGVMCFPLHIINAWEKKRFLQKEASSRPHP